MSRMVSYMKYDLDELKKRALGYKYYLCIGTILFIFTCIINAIQISGNIFSYVVLVAILFAFSKIWNSYYKQEDQYDK